jgi:hypothetical protein
MPTEAGGNPSDLTIVTATELDPNQAKADVSTATTATPPDPATLQRLISLGKVGTKLKERVNDGTLETDFLVILQDLAEFEAGIDKLTLEPPVKKGMTDLIAYLREKVQKRMRSTVEGKDLP